MTKGAQGTMDSNWIPGAGVGILGSIAAWLLSWRINTAAHEAKTEADAKASERIAQTLRQADTVRADDLRSELREFKDDWKAGIADVRRLADSVSTLQGSQNAFNATTAKALDSITAKLDRHDDVIADHAATLRILVGAMDSKKDRVRCDRESGFCSPEETR